MEMFTKSQLTAERVPPEFFLQSVLPSSPPAPQTLQSLQSQRSTNRPFPLLSSAKRELGKNRLDCQRPCYCAFHEANDVP